MSNLENAISLAVQAHKGQRDKSGRPYILHPLRIMCRLQTDTEMIVALLHDVIEDTTYTLDDLDRMGYASEVIDAVDCLTHREGESYDDYLVRVQTNVIATRVKLYDLEDNMDVRRMKTIEERDVERLRKYRSAYATLLKDS